jgi:putative transposase
MSRHAPQILISPKIRGILEGMTRAHKTPQRLAERVRIVLGASEGRLNSDEAAELGVDPQRVSRWRRRWFEDQGRFEEAESKGATDGELEAQVVRTLSDLYRSGVKPKFTAEQMVQIIALACEKPEDSELPVTHWTPKDVAAEAIRRGIVESISVRHVDRFLKGGRFAPPQEPLLVDVIEYFNAVLAKPFKWTYTGKPLTV